MRAVAARLALASALGACAPTGPAGVDAGVDGAVDAGGRDAAIDPCDVLFGAPNETTGLDATRCRPVCACGGASFAPRAWTEADLTALAAATLLDPPATPSVDPYASPAPPPAPEGTVCAVVPDALDAYRVETFASDASATAAGAVVTHAGACGLCSSLQDLAAYAGHPDLTAPVRACGLSHASDFAGLVGCLEALGFTTPCATIWAYNTEHTRAACGAVCLRWLGAPYHLEDGGLNPCLACDEAESGAVFKAVAGRTRRNSGLANAMCRPCAEVVRLDHAYPFL